VGEGRAAWGHAGFSLVLELELELGPTAVPLDEPPESSTSTALRAEYEYEFEEWRLPLSSPRYLVTSFPPVQGLGPGRIRTPEAERGSGEAATPAGVGDSFGPDDPGLLRTPG